MEQKYENSLLINEELKKQYGIFLYKIIKKFRR